MDLPETAKGRGHLAELLFAAEGAKRGNIVLTPGGDNCPFDVVLYTPTGKFFRVQVKSCLKKEEGRSRYTFTIKRGGTNHHRSYEEKDVDILACYSFAEEVWYLVPVVAVLNETTIKIDSSGRFDQYKENWNLFK